MTLRFLRKAVDFFPDFGGWFSDVPVACGVFDWEDGIQTSSGNLGSLGIWGKDMDLLRESYPKRPKHSSSGFMINCRDD